MTNTFSIGSMTFTIPAATTTQTVSFNTILQGVVQAAPAPPPPQETVGVPSLFGEEFNHQGMYEYLEGAEDRYAAWDEYSPADHREFIFWCYWEMATSKTQNRLEEYWNTRRLEDATFFSVFPNYPDYILSRFSLDRLSFSTQTLKRPSKVDLLDPDECI